MGAFDTTVGVLLIGISFNTFLYGLVTYQFLVYKNTKFNDPIWIKTVVAALFAVDTIHSAVAIYAAWETCVTNYGNPESLLEVGWTIPFTAVATSCAAIITQFFLTHRVYKLTNNIPIVIFLAILSLLGFAFGVYAGVDSGIINEVRNFAPLTPFVICWLGFSTAADLSITIVLSFVLSRSRTGFRKTDTIVNRLIRGAIQTGLFVSIFALADLFSFVLHRDTLLYAMFAYPIGRIYSNTLLDTLNSRVQLKRLAAGSVEETGDVSDSFRMKNQSDTFANNSLPLQVSKKVETSVSNNNHLDTKFTADEVYSAA